MHTGTISAGDADQTEFPSRSAQCQALRRTRRDGDRLQARRVDSKLSSAGARRRSDRKGG